MFQKKTFFLVKIICRFFEDILIFMSWTIIYIVQLMNINISSKKRQIMFTRKKVFFWNISKRRFLLTIKTTIGYIWNCWFIIFIVSSSCQLLLIGRSHEKVRISAFRGQSEDAIARSTDCMDNNIISASTIPQLFRRR